MNQENKDALLGLVALIAIALFLIGIVPGFGVFGFYKLEPNYAAVEVSRITGDVGEPIMNVENGGIENIHYRWVWITRLEKFDTKIHTIEIKSFGEQREGSMDLFHKDGLDYEQYPNNIIVGYKLEPENLKSYYIEVVRLQMGYETDKRSVLEKVIKGTVFNLLTEQNLNKKTLEAALIDRLGNDFVKITSVDFTQKITG